MTLAQLVDRWIEMAGLVESIDAAAARITAEVSEHGTARQSVGGALGMHMTALVAPDRAAPALGRVSPVVERAIAEESSELGADDGVGAALINLVSYVDVVDCTHGAMSSSVHDAIRDWLPRAEVSRDDPSTADYWSVGYAALALGDRALVRRFAPDKPFVSGDTFQFNLQGLLAHLAAAIDAKATVDDVMPAWDDLIASFPMLMGARSVNLATMLWIARVVFHDIAGHPIETVMRRLHDAMWTAAGKTP